MMINSLILLLALATTTTRARFMPNGMPYQQAKCELVTNPMCKELDPKNYIYTSFPNYMNHSSAEVANRELDNYVQIIESNCSQVLKMFLCTLYVPICKPGVGASIPPCRSLCKEARKGCEPLLHSAFIKWPSSMNCDRFPEENTGLCVGLPESYARAEEDEEKPIVSAENHIPSKRTAVKKGITNESNALKRLKPMQEIELRCNDDKQILVRRVRHWPEQVTECCPVDSTEAISKSCNGKQSCTVVLDKNIIGEGCVKNMEHTSVKYKCVRKDRDVTVRKSIGCRNRNKTRN